ncbi:MAG TPA: PBP1A family penicillin-binding protein [Candidatus Dormibacteraeota bacterium]|nr:PBP1A family penicillin-binding protein [Candidatus Dormibacteraeota bacterium]
MAVTRTRRRRFLAARRLFLGAIAVTGFVAVAAGAFVYRQFMESLPPIQAAVDYQPPTTTQIFAADGSLIGEFYSQKRYLVPLDRIPAYVRQAFISAEDDSFYQHQGVDTNGILRAFVNNLIAGGKVQGGSTITQQVVKTVLLTPQKSYERKLKEIILSTRLEHEVSKDDILALYLNHIYLGSGAYGVAAAADEYFGKSIEDVTLSEAALLAGLPQAPSRYSPYRHWPEAKARQRYVLNRMYEEGYIDRETRDAAIVDPISLSSRRGSFQAAPYFVEHVRKLLEEQYGRTVLYELGLRVKTTLDPRMQAEAESALRRGIERLTAEHGGYHDAYREMSHEERDNYLRLQEAAFRGMERPEGGFSYEALVSNVRGSSARVQVGRFAGDLVLPVSATGKQAKLGLMDLVRARLIEDDDNGDHSGPLRFEYDPSPLLEGALLAMEPGTGNVRAMVGGYDFDRSHFNRAIQARRQPGSAFKPLVYAAALDRNFTPASVIVDEPVSYNDHGRVWTPQNFDKKYHGPTSLREALTKSRNVVTVRLAERIGLTYLTGYLPRFGLPGPIPHNLSISLGSLEVTPIELATAYSTFANNGQRPTPLMITEISDGEGQVLERNEPQVTQVLPPTTAYQMTSMLQDVVRRGTGTAAQGLAQPTAGKTGTTNDLEDAWFVGYTPQLLAVVWIGFDNKRPLGPKSTGGHVAAPIWKDFMADALKDVPEGQFPVPNGLRCVNIDPQTGTRAGAGGSPYLECFREGSEPQPGAVPAVPVVQMANDAPHRQPSTLEFMKKDY